MPYLSLRFKATYLASCGRAQTEPMFIIHPQTPLKNRKIMLHRYSLLLFLLALGLGISAQDCQYQLLLTDTEEDGWNGGEVTLRVAGVATTYTLTREMNDAGQTTVFFMVNDGDEVQIDFRGGAFPEEIGFSILDNNDSLIYTAPANLMTTTNLFSFTAACVACAGPPAASVVFSRVRSTSVEVTFAAGPSAANPLYRLEYGPGNFDPNTGSIGQTITRADTMFRINNLMPDTRYQFWISTICQAESDTTARRGPFEVLTQKRADVGITALMSPQTGCDLGLEEVTIGITNFGGEPQQFFNVDYLINDQPAGVSRPEDGIFTGVVGVDSTEFFTFDLRASLNRPGTYKFTLFTQLEGDEDPSNDTLVIFVNHVPLITNFPYHEDFEANDGFWYKERAGRAAASWRWGEPLGTIIDRAPDGRNAWVTNLRGDYNNEEKSYLYSPCFDLADMTEAPLFSAVLQVETEADFDNVYLEMTKDRGENWSRVENSPAAFSWYNDLANRYWEGDGGFNGMPRLVGNLLEGAAGEEIQLRFVFNSGLSDTREGVLVDAVSLGQRAERNLAAVSAEGDADCGILSNTELTFTFANVGTTTADNIQLSFSADGVMNTETFPDSLRPGQQATYTFLEGTPGNAFSGPIRFWVSLADDVEPGNDTTLLFFQGIQDLPFFEGFDGAGVPEKWRADDDFTIGVRPGNASATLSTLLNAADTLGTFATATYRDILTTDTLRFDVALSDTDNPDEYTGVASLTILADYCDAAAPLFQFDTLQPGSYALAIPEEAAGVAGFIFEVRRLSGSFVVDYDNISIARCPESLGLIPAIVGVSRAGRADALVTIVPTAGLPPYRYEWSTGDEGATVDGLAEGEVTVIVTDAVGCTDAVTFTIDMTVAVDQDNELLAGLLLSPNPTDGRLNLQLTLPEAAPLRADVYDLTGRRVLRRDFGTQRELNTALDLTAYPAGIYLVRLQAGDAAKTVRVIKR
ncbi:T9SS type A sorting domain-containing protein [Neolewinella lacunae]|uniref:T9SS type A sorting domain-containing protein n=1 Tax=Neolewinella lacunae TaxID=1517758 RepID=A0A923PK74_9BACT|nr:T9SS type A sorting domain-containing protein [Neolewinella lacunae]MBC6992718.1 T9SS type A sorting domain-containing protein [Neolewinella lacunae]MDN3635962.1 T9SS type A sorting domain-containing protein [Neolewinella lacunae]